MFEKILVPLDGSALADRILPHVAAIAEGNGAPITLLRVLVTGDMAAVPIDPLTWHFAKAEAQAHLEEAAGKLAALGLPSETVLLEGEAAQHIVGYAQRGETDLIVLSSHGQGGLSGWKVSGIALKVIHLANTSVMLVRSAYVSSEERSEVDDWRIRYRKILVPLDGSQRAEAVLPLAAALAERHGAAMLCVNVVSRPQMIQRVPPTPEDALFAERIITRNKTEADKYFDQLKSRLPSQARVRVLVDENVALALHRLVEDEGIDLVMLSAHGQSYQDEWPYSTLVNTFITYGTSSLVILQDHPLNRSQSDSVARQSEQPVPSSHRLNGEEGLVTRGQSAN